MVAYMNDPSNPQNAYPAYWAPFVVVGDVNATLGCALAATSARIYGGQLKPDADAGGRRSLSFEQREQVGVIETYG